MKDLAKQLLLLLCCVSISITTKAQFQFEFQLNWEQDVFPNNPYRIQFDELQRPYFYVANDNGGVRIFKNEQNADPVQIDQLYPLNWNFLKVMDITQQGNYLYLALGSIFDFFPQEFGIAIINVENPEAAYVTDYWRNGSPSEGSAIIKVQGDYAFLGAMGEGLHIFNISDPEEIMEVSTYLPDVNFPIPNPNVIQEPNARGMAVKDDLVYLCNDAGGLRIIDISTIDAPNEINHYIHTDFIGVTAQAYNNVILHDTLAYIAADFCGLEIISVADPMDLFQVSIWNPWSCESPDNFWQNSPGHTNQLRFLPGYEGEILIVNGNDTEMIALDVSEPSNPIVLDTFGTVGDSIRTWGIGMSETQIAAAYYTSNAPWISKQSSIKLFDWSVSTTSIKESAIVDYSLAPNPNNGRFTLRLNAINQGQAFVRLYDLLGREVLTEHKAFLDGQLDFDLQAYNLSGIYFLQLKIGQQLLTTKLLIHGERS